MVELGGFREINDWGFMEFRNCDEGFDYVDCLVCNIGSSFYHKPSSHSSRFSRNIAVHQENIM